MDSIRIWTIAVEGMHVRTFSMWPRGDVSCKVTACDGSCKEKPVIEELELEADFVIHGLRRYLDKGEWPIGMGPIE